MNALYIRLAGPLQSWAGTKVSGNISYTENHPTRSGLEGLIAACLGCPRGEFPQWFRNLNFSVRVDSPGTVCDDYQTIGVRDEDWEFAERLFSVITGKKATGKNLKFVPDGQGINSIVRRTLLADAEFLVRIQCDGHLEDIDNAVSNPKFVPYLGRKAFSPGFPFYLGVGDESGLELLPRFEKKSIKITRITNEVEAPKAEPRSVEVHHLSYLTQPRLELVRPPVVTNRKEWLDRIQDQLRRRVTLPR